MLRGQKVACGVTAARQQQPEGRQALRLAARLPARAEEGRRDRLRRLRAPPVLRRPGGVAGDSLARPRRRPLGNIDALVSELTRLYGRKRIWITEYGYQTNPPDGVFGVSWSTQAAYVRQSFAIARAHPRIDMLLWFLLQDEGDPEPGGSPA